MIEGAEEEAVVRVGLGRMQAGSELGTLCRGKSYERPAL